MSIRHDDMLIRQIERLAQAIAEAVFSRPHIEELEDADVEALCGVGVQTALAMDSAVTLRRLSPNGALDAQAALALGLAVLRRAMSATKDEDVELARGRAAVLIAAAIEADPDLLTPVVSLALGQLSG